MKVGLVLDDTLDSSDGVQQYVLSIGSWLATNGHDVHYLVGQTTREDIPNVHSLSRNIGVRFNGNRLSVPLPARRARIKRLLEQESFDILHVQVPYSPWLAQRVIKAAGGDTAIVGTFHIAPYSKLVSVATWFLARWLRSSLKRFDAIVSVSSAAASYAQSTFGIATTVIPNTVDFSLFHDAEPLPIYDDAIKTILFLGRLVKRKGCMRLLEAVAKLQSRNDLPEFRVIICGTGPLAAELQAYVGSHNLTDISFIGFVSNDEKPNYYSSADIAVFPSSGGESFGIVLIEAMSNGRTAVLGGDNSGYHSVLGSKPELLFPANDVDALADRVAALLTNSEMQHDFASWGVEYAATFDIEIVGKQVVDLYTQALHK